MASPRVFISSTFYDLRHVRADLERMIRELGYEPIRNETGAIPYSKDEKLETSAYREVELSDILVSIIGGRYGTESRDYPRYSITQSELRRALDRGVQVFIFIEAQVLAEYRTFVANRDRDIKWVSVDNKKVFEFIEEIYRLPINNAVTTFENSEDICTFLKAQWAGLFQRFLSKKTRESELNVLDQMNSVAKTLQDLVGFLTEERKSRDDAVKRILMANHPLFRQLAKLTNTPYRIYFENRDEMRQWMIARAWNEVEDKLFDQNSVEEWIDKKAENYIVFATPMFDANGKLILYTDDDWEDDWISKKSIKASAREEDDIPF